MTFTRRLVLALLMTCASTLASASEPVRSAGHFGLGIGSGTLSNGIDAKYFLDRGSSLQFNLGELSGHGWRHRWHHFDDGVGFGVDYLLEMPDITRAGRAFDLGWSIGGGLALGFGEDWDDHHDGRDDTGFAAAFVLGLELNFIPAPFDVVIEWRPSLLFVPDVDFDAIDFTAHVRFYF